MQMALHYDIKWLIDQYENGETLEFLYFWGHSNTYNQDVGKFCFSQWFESIFIVEGKTYYNAEQWMMAQKAQLFEDDMVYEQILATSRPADVKELGRKVKGFNEEIWNEKRFEIVKLGNIHKFNQNRAFGNYLLKTENKIIIEASPNDAVWGIGLHKTVIISRIFISGEDLTFLALR
jgi:ribA/ribD-fused uncharacterized protein